MKISKVGLKTYWNGNRICQIGNLTLLDGKHEYVGMGMWTYWNKKMNILEWKHECVGVEYDYRSLPKKGPLTNERPPPTFGPISCIGSKFT